ncbi:MAG: hypothetical protein LBS31_01195, partial [Candidatus Adiutrix sp.]|nr:hypothetical protein [Candidatus Adiutrix sp.]
MSPGDSAHKEPDTAADRQARTAAALPPRKRRTLRLVLVLVNLFILAIPVSGLSLFRIYENELVR